MTQTLKVQIFAILLLTSSSALSGPLEIKIEPQDYSVNFLTKGAFLEVRNGATEICEAAARDNPSDSASAIAAEVKRRGWTDEQAMLLNTVCLAFYEGKMVGFSNALGAMADEK